ncbi:hypothetical protein PIB30_020598 [Stylosanthes scabra]|uniref:Uncharacterized protein n=1 Tax=Stylosanthes scabra TaxID=79078 RepID=A0ABU6R918_9FABA|nr:hypothetical protein [Stylosanthes scabra]
MGNRVIFYEYKAHKEYDDVNVEETAELGMIKIHRYHFNDEKFTYSVHSGRFDHDRPYEFPIATLGSGDTFGDFRPTPMAATALPQVPHTEPTLSLGPSIQTYPPCYRLPHVFKKSTLCLVTPHSREVRWAELSIDQCLKS